MPQPPSHFHLRHRRILRITPSVASRLLPLSLFAALLTLLPSPTAAADTGAAPTDPLPALIWTLKPTAIATSDGVWLDQLVEPTSTPPPPRIRLAPPPAPSRPLTLTRLQIQQALRQLDPSNTPPVFTWSGASQISIHRKSRPLTENELTTLLTQVLQRDYVRDRGDLELQLTRPWTPTQVPDDPLSVRVLELPVAGVTSSFIARFEIRAGNEVAGIHQVQAQARILREVWVANTPLQRGQPVSESDLAREPRDLLTVRNALTQLPENPTTFEIAENITPGTALSTRSIRPRRIIQRGRLLDALLQDGPLVISIRVEALEDGHAGQIVRVRNVRTRREFRGRVQDEETIRLTL